MEEARGEMLERVSLRHYLENSRLIESGRPAG
jgi:hypothetical protein